MNTLLRWFVALPLTLFGCLAYLAAPLIGVGVHLGPEPGLGMLFAGGALVAIIGGYCAVRSYQKASFLATIINVVLILGALSLAHGVIQWGFETHYHVQTSEASHSEPGAVLFMMSYGTLSVAGLGIFNKWVRQANVSTPTTVTNRA